MMSIYKINFKQLRQEPAISEMLSALERGLNKFDIDFYLVGAVARDVWMSAINGILPSRITGDIDFAVFIDDKETYNELKKYLVEIEGFAPHRGNAFVLIWKGYVQVDLLPFGAIEGHGDSVSIDGVGLTSVNMPAFKEIYLSGLPTAELEEKHTFKFCTLPGIVLLKLIAYQDRPEIRRDDIKDISKILKHFFDMYANEIFDNHNDLFGNDPNLNLLAARVMGREVAKIAQLNQQLYERVNDLLVLNTKSPETSEIGKIMAEFFENSIEDNISLLNNLITGLQDNM
jgi:predicted nucleotidyltransferase